MYDQENSNQEFGGAASGPENGGQMSGSEANNAGSGSTYNENSAASDSAARSQSGEYRYRRDDLPHPSYMDANFVPQSETQSGPRNYYTPPVTPPPAQEKPKKVKKPRKPVNPMVKWIAACLVCALLGGIGGGALVASRIGGNSGAATSSGSALTKASESTSSGASATTVASGETLTGSQIYSLGCKQAVGITTEITSTNYFGMQSTSAVSGSGFIVTADGYIVTNYHVIADAYTGGYKVSVMTYDGTKYDAEIRGVDGSNDIAVLKINASGLTPATLGNSDNLQVGDTVYAIGNPLGELSFSLTSGSVSALDRDITTQDSTTGATTTNNMFQFDAAVNEGNSGGPVYNTKGEVVGIVTAKYASTGVEGLGFAIPINNISDIVNQLIKQGYVSGQSSLGITVKTVDSAVAQYYNMVQGAYVDSVNAGSCSEKAGVKKGDIITALNDKQITSTSDLASAKKNYKAGETVTLKIYRSGAYQELKVTLDEEKNTGSTSSSGSVTQQLPSVPKAST